MIVYAATNRSGQPVAVAQGPGLSAAKFVRCCVAQHGRHPLPVIDCWAYPVLRDHELVRYWTGRAPGRVRTLVGCL